MKTRETNKNVFRELFVYLKKIAVIDNIFDHTRHIIGLVGIVRDDSIQRGIRAFGCIRWDNTRCIVHIVRGKIGH